MENRRRPITCVADTPVRVKVSVVHTFRYEQVLCRSRFQACPRRDFRSVRDGISVTFSETAGFLV
jgi:hypothetical protein